ncbi:alpha/beta hydrolase, partial [Actinoplanes sp. NPDC051633]|uniref:alpha/beta fold hydrolase n=1 Tax=Actinoplanes sp. NPDC051633 TaxID=3155670 RepID=UPI00343E8AE7
MRLGEVDTWYAEQGSGEPLVLFHPGGADSRAFEISNLAGLAERYHTYRYDRRGHGRTPDVAGPISFGQMADDGIAFIENLVGGPVHILGHSDGAPVALLVAQKRPDLVRRMVFASGVFHHEGWLPGVLDVDEEADRWLADWYGEVSPDGRDHWAVVSEKLRVMHRIDPALTTDDLAAIEVPTLLMFGDQDEVEPAHVHAMHRAMPNAQLAIVPGTG